MRAVERVDVAALGQPRPAARLYGTADLQRQFIEVHFPRRGVETPGARQPPQRAVGTDVVEPVIVDSDMGEVRRHPLERARSAQLEERAVTGGVELQQRG